MIQPTKFLPPINPEGSTACSQTPHNSNAASAVDVLIDLSPQSTTERPKTMMRPSDDDSLYNDDQSLFDGEDDNELALQSSQGSARIAKEDIQLMNVVRAIVILSLLTFAVISAETVFIISLIAEENNFKDAFESTATILTNTMYERISNKIWVAKTFAHDLAIDAQNSALVWPHMTFNHFLDRCRGPLHMSQSVAIKFSPFVSENDRVPWEEIAALTYPTISNENVFPSMKQDITETVSTDDVMYHVTHRTANQGIYQFVDEVAQDQELASEGYFPIWQQAPEPPADPGSPETLIGTMFNLESLEDRASGLQTMLAREGSSISQFLFEGSAGQDYAVFSPPRSAIYAPIYELSNSSSTTNKLRTVGSVEFEFHWEQVFGNVLTGIDLPLFAVVENTCGNRQFTYVVEGQEVVFSGEGDLHTDDVDGYEDISSNPEDFEALFLEHSRSPDVVMDGNCTYFVSYFPTGTFKKHFVTNNPEAYRGLVLGIFIFIIGIFWAYDTLVEKRQGKVVDAAAKSDAIVRSLFPSNVRDRLYEQSQASKKPEGKDAWKNPDAPHSQGGIIETPKNKLKSFISKSPEDQAVHANQVSKGALSEPIADLIPQTTIMFADVSSSRKLLCVDRWQQH